MREVPASAVGALVAVQVTAAVSPAVADGGLGLGAARVALLAFASLVAQVGLVVGRHALALCRGGGKGVVQAAGALAQSGLKGRPLPFPRRLLSAAHALLPTSERTPI